MNFSNKRSYSTFYSNAAFLLVSSDHMGSEHGRLEMVGWDSVCTFLHFLVLSILLQLETIYKLSSKLFQFRHGRIKIDNLH